MPAAHDPWRRVWVGLALLGVVLGVSTGGYMLLGLGVVDAVYQSVTTISTVGFRELGETTSAWKFFTISVILAGVGTSLYTLGVLVETLVEGRITDTFGRRRMERHIAGLSDHVIVCGWGRVGRTVANYLDGARRPIVVVDRDPLRLARVTGPVVEGDATDDAVLRRAGIDRAGALVAALNTDADNLYVTLTGRSLRKDLFIVARARVDSAEPKLLQAGADRVVNPQQIGGARMAALVAQPNVAQFLDVVMHDGSLEFRLAEIEVPDGSAIAGRSLRDAHIRDRTGALVLALRNPDGQFTTNPTPETTIESRQVLIAIGTQAQLEALTTSVRSNQ
ncbi:MAG: potassium channel family protein [Acidimicrobiales bacterium]